ALPSRNNLVVSRSPQQNLCAKLKLSPPSIQQPAGWRVLVQHPCILHHYRLKPSGKSMRSQLTSSSPPVCFQCSKQKRSMEVFYARVNGNLRAAAKEPIC